MYEIIEYISKRYKSRGWIQSWNVSSDETWQMQSSILDIYQINELFYIVTCFNCHNVSLLLLFVSYSTSDLVLGVSLKHLIPFKGRFHSKIDFSPAHFPTWCWWRHWGKFLIHVTIPDFHRGKPSLSSSSIWEVNTTSYNQISTLASSQLSQEASILHFGEMSIWTHHPFNGNVLSTSSGCEVFVKGTDFNVSSSVTCHGVLRDRLNCTPFVMKLFIPLRF